jgi:hypothetical protein
MFGRKGMTKLVQEETHAKWPLTALVAVLGFALPAIQLGTLSNALDYVDLPTVRIARRVAKDQLRP